MKKLEQEKDQYSKKGFMKYTKSRNNSIDLGKIQNNKITIERDEKEKQMKERVSQKVDKGNNTPLPHNAKESLDTVVEWKYKSKMQDSALNLNEGKGFTKS